MNSSITKAIFTMLCSLVFFDIMGAIIKHLALNYPVQQLSVFRNLFGMIPTMILIGVWDYRSQGWQVFRIRRWKLVLIRGVVTSLAQFSFYLSLTRLEFATASTIGFATPFVVAGLSVLMLKQRVGLHRWSAVFLGFSGIVMVMRPGTDVFSWHALLPLLAACGYGFTIVTAQMFEDSEPTSVITFFSQFTALVSSTILVLATSGFSVVHKESDWLWILGMGLSGGLAVYGLIKAYRMTEPSNLAPFEYFGLPSSFVVGWIMFDETPVGRLFPGVLLVLAGGMLIIQQQRKSSISK